MGIWSTIAGIGLTAAGVVTGQPELIAPGIGLVASGLQSDQVSKASNAQQQSAQQGLGLLSDIYGQQKAMLNPYAQLGAGALPNLYALTGQKPPMQGTTAPGFGQGPMGSGFNAQQMAAMQQPGWSAPSPIQGGWSQQWQGPGVNPMFDPRSPGAQAGGGQGMATLRAPDGSTKAVPADQVEFYLSKGATRVG